MVSGLSGEVSIIAASVPRRPCEGAVGVLPTALEMVVC